MISQAMPKYPVFDFYAEGLNATEKAMTFWSGMYRSASDLTWWWTEKWLEAPATLTAWNARVAERAAPAAQAALTLVETVADAPAEVAKAAEPVPQAIADDLTQLVGIGPKLSAALAERGVTRFAQIAGWTDADVAEIDQALDLKGRAVRDAWVAQAKRFLEA